MAHFEAVLFDWMLTLAHYPPPADHVAQALQRLGRPADADDVEPIVAAMATARQLPEVEALQAIEDTSPDAHHRSEHLLYQRAGIDDRLATEMYGLLGQPSFHPCYPDVPEVLATLHGAGIGIAVVSDIHVDLRSHAEVFGFDEHVDVWALSYELGVQKPDHKIFTAALTGLGADPSRTLMVGDRPTRDGVAVELGLTCLVVPAPRSVDERRLDHVLHLVGV